MEIVSELTNNNLSAKRQYKVYTNKQPYHRTVSTRLTLYAISILTILGIICLVAFLILTILPFLLTSSLIKLLPREEPCKHKLVVNSEHLKHIL